MKRSRALLLAAVPLTLLATTLTACTASGGTITEDASGAACAPAGDASKSIKVKGDSIAELELTSKTPVTSESLERSVLKPGTGDVFAAGASVTTSYAIYNGATGDLVNQQADIPVPNDEEQLAGADWMYQLVRCANDGQRATVVLPATEALGGDPAEMGVTDVTADDSFIIVADFAQAEEACEELTARDEKFPEVDLGKDGDEPVITIPECMEAPDELELEVLVEGDGPEVKADEAIMTNYVGVYWNGAERFDGNWTETGIEFSTAEGALIEGFRSAMIGQKIGSTILVTMPSEMGYNDGEVRTFVLQLVSKAGE